MKKLSKKYRWWGLGGTLIQYGVPLGYIISRYDIFRFEDARYSLTGWGFIGIATVFFLFRSKIKAFVDDYNKHLGNTAQRGKWGVIFLTIFGLFALASFWLHGVQWFMFTLGVSNLGSLILYAPYDNGKNNYNELKQLIAVKQNEEKIKSITI